MPTPTYTSLGTITLASTDSEIVFSSIPATYRDLIVVATFAYSTDAPVLVKLNGDGTAGNYTGVFMRGFATTSVDSSTVSNNISYMTNGNYQNYLQFSVMDYSATDKHKTMLVRDQFLQGIGNQVTAKALRWANTAAVNSVGLNVSTSFGIGSTFSLFGVA